MLEPREPAKPRVDLAAVGAQPYVRVLPNGVGGSGEDLVSGGQGNDSVDGGAGADWAYGGEGTDTVLGGAGDDYTEGGAGNDRVSGGSGNDWVIGGAGADKLFGDDGNDMLDGGPGADAFDGGRGFDQYRNQVDDLIAQFDRSDVRDVKQGEAGTCVLLASLLVDLAVARVLGGGAGSTAGVVIQQCVSAVRAAATVLFAIMAYREIRAFA